MKNPQVNIQSFIVNSSFPKSLSGLEVFVKRGESDLDWILNSYRVSWNTPKWAKIGDIVFFYISKESITYVKYLINHFEEEKVPYSPKMVKKFEEWLQYGKEMAEKYSGKIIAIGKVIGEPERDDDFINENFNQKIFSSVEIISVLKNPVHISEFNDFITITRGGEFTVLGMEDFEKLRTLIKSKNKVPAYFDQAIAAPIPMTKINQDNWLELTNSYRRSFFLEKQFRDFYVNYLLRDLGDTKTVYSECRCVKKGISDSFIDSLMKINGKYLPVEVKLNASTEKDLQGQVRKYSYDEAIYAGTSKDSEKIILPENVWQNRVMIIDTDKIFMYDADKDEYPEMIFELDNLKTKADIQKLKAIVLDKLY